MRKALAIKFPTFVNLAQDHQQAQWWLHYETNWNINHLKFMLPFLISNMIHWADIIQNFWRDLMVFRITWWRHQMETFSALLAICAGNSPVPGEFPAQRPVTRSFDVFFDLRLNKRLSKQFWGRWFETQLRPLWRHRNESFPCSSPLHMRPVAVTSIRLYFVWWELELWAHPRRYGRGQHRCWSRTTPRRGPLSATTERRSAMKRKL